MRQLVETAARALRARREMAVAITTAAVAAVLIIGGQGDLAAIVAAGAAGLMAGRACRYRLTAQELRRQTAELGDELSDTESCVFVLSQTVQEREEDLSWFERQVRLSLADGRKNIIEYKSLLREEEATSRLFFLFSESLRDWSRELDALEANLNSASQELIGEQTQLVDLLSPEEVDAFYGDSADSADNDTEKEVNTNDDAEE
ncbi:MAG: hypothetical protein HXL04_02200 [Candidatus Nanosynbacter sp.]|nr:hypothetical protein [Candidatus Nanosynbacter sp.]